MPLFRFARARWHEFRVTTSALYRHQTLMAELVSDGRYREAKAFLDSERIRWEKRTRRMPGSKTRALAKARVEMDYSQLFDSFSKAIRARMLCQDLILRDAPFAFWRFSLRERRQIEIERLRKSVPLSTSSWVWAGRKTGENRPFKEAIDSRRVLVIGPAPAHELTQEFVNSFDVVALPKFYGDLWIGQDLSIGDHQKVVTYFNHLTVARLGNEVKVTKPHWDFCRVKSQEDVNFVRNLYGEYLEQPQSVGLMELPDTLLQNHYGPFMGTAMIYDLVVQKPSEVFLTGFSFFVQNKAIYRSSYDSSRHGESLILESLRTHGAFSNFLFVKNLFVTGVVQADVEVSKILGLSSLDYAERLDQRFQGLL